MCSKSNMVYLLTRCVIAGSFYFKEDFKISTASGPGLELVCNWSGTGLALVWSGFDLALVRPWSGTGLV